MRGSMNGFEAVLAQLQAEFSERMRSDAVEIAAAWADAQTDEGRADGLSRLIQLSHKLAGLGKTMGFAEVSTASFAVEQSAEDIARAGAPCSATFAAQVAALQQALQSEN